MYIDSISINSIGIEYDIINDSKRLIRRTGSNNYIYIGDISGIIYFTDSIYIYGNNSNYIFSSYDGDIELIEVLFNE